MRVLRHPGGRQAPIFRQESEGGIRRRMRRQPGGKSGWRWSLGMGPSGRAAGTYGARFDGSHRGLGNGGCCEVGEPAGALFDAAARDDQHGYVDKSLLEVGHGSSRAVSGAPPPLKTPKCGGWDRPGFVVASPWWILYQGLRELVQPGWQYLRAHASDNSCERGRLCERRARTRRSEERVKPRPEDRHTCGVGRRGNDLVDAVRNSCVARRPACQSREFQPAYD